MANDLQTTTDRAAGLMRLMTPSARSVLAGDYWRPDYARQALARIQTEPKDLLAAYDLAMAPVAHDWLAERLRRLWKSSPVSGSLDAPAWVSETGRLLSDIPQSILADAIDTAVKNSARGFMPTVGEIRTIAEPRMRELRLERWRLQQVIDAEPSPDAEPEPRCTPEEAAAILAKFGIKTESEKPVRAFNAPPEKPDRQWYIDHGFDPDAKYEPTTENLNDMNDLNPDLGQGVMLNVGINWERRD